MMKTKLLIIVLLFSVSFVIKAIVNGETLTEKIYINNK